MTKYRLYINTQFEKLYLGKTNGKIDCVPDVNNATIIDSEEEAKDIRDILAHRNLWNIETFEHAIDSIEENISEENNE